MEAAGAGALLLFKRVTLMIFRHREHLIRILPFVPGGRSNSLCRQYLQYMVVAVIGKSLLSSHENQTYVRK